jgi:DNA-binding CsgD family transcriptional regulator
MQSSLHFLFSYLAAAVRAGALTVWFWLLLYADVESPEIFWTGESCPLTGMLPWAAVLLFLGACRPQVVSRVMGGRWSGPLPAFCLLAALTPFFWQAGARLAGGWPWCALAGLGLALAFLSQARLWRRAEPAACAAGIGGGIWLGSLIVELGQELAPYPLLAVLAGSALLAGVHLPRKDEPAPACAVPERGLLLLAAACCLLSGLAVGGYLALWEIFSPLPQGTLKGEVFDLLAVSAPALALLLSRRNGPLLLAVLPFAIVAYTTWPLFHRESPALSLQSLHVSHMLLTVWTLTLLCLLSGRQQGRQDYLCWGGGLLLCGILLGMMTRGALAHCLARGTAVNLLFLAFAVLALVCCGLWGRVWQKWLSGQEARPCLQPGGEPVVGEGGVPEDLDVCREMFRGLGLTPQQALIAAMLAHKQHDADICRDLSISPSTLKTHIRNILRRTGINSRHELPWLLLSVGPARQERKTGR